jgi:hypothetical protein
MKEFIAGVLTVIMMVGFIFACFGYTWGGWVGIATAIVGALLFSEKENE